MASIGNLRMAARLMRAGPSLRLCSAARISAPSAVRSKSVHAGQTSGFSLLSTIKIQSIPFIRFTSSLPKLSEDDVRMRVVSVCKNFDKINADKLNLETHFMNDLGLDSLDHVELVMAMEDEFGFEITDADAEKLVRPAEIVKYVVARYQARE